MFLASAERLAELVPQSQLDRGTLYPELKDIRSVSAHIAAAVGEEIFRLGLNSVPKPDDILQFMVEQQYDTRYDSFVL